ncbi:eukaryotic translation initiation factor 4 gamma 3-like isoform X2 [Oncorhynchus keta]|uniref:eukaryotic translation initiation factor 4 gamma 3-like isoform X2 n=1 Tax=Oncorhynchus keta TaxID=8018 RepID=UPI0015FCADB6|nr:eukaryotic translation initiation factor 4 gamma 3-like isoform X2 [Oncorhynchus keta]
MLRNQHLVNKKRKKMSGTKKTCKQETQSPAPSSSGQAVEKQNLKDFQDPEPEKTQELYAQMDNILDRVNQNNFQQSMLAITEFTINTEARLKGIIHLIYERALAHPTRSVTYANICRCLMGLRVPTAAKPGVTVNFRTLFLNRVQANFENMTRNSCEIFRQKQEMVDAITKEEERQRVWEELEEAKTEERRQSLGNIKLMCELFKLKMLTEHVMHDVIVQLLKNQDENSLEGLCTLLYTIGKDLDFKKARPRMDQYYNMIVKIMKNRTTSPRITSMLQGVLDLRKKETAQLGELVEKMEKTGLQADNDAEKHTGPGDTEPVLRPHYKSLAMKNQKLISTSIPLQENTCPHHDDKLKAEDSAAAWGATKKKKVNVQLKTCQQIIQEREEELQKLRQEVESLKCLSQATIEDSERFFTKLIETRCSEVREVIQAKEKEMVSEAEGLLQTLEQELDELKRTETEGRQLPHIDVYPHFLQKLPSITEAFEEVRTCASEMQQQFEDSSKLQFVEFSKSVEESLGPYTISSLSTSRQAVEEKDLDLVDLETVKTEEMYEQMDNILTSLTPKNFHQSMKVVSAFTIDTEDKLQGIIDSIYERVILNPTSAEVYAKVCNQLKGLKIPGVTVNFRKLLLNQCQKGFEKDNRKILKEKQRELDTTTEEEDRQRLREELEEAKAEGQRELLCNITFICHLFKLKMMTEGLIDYCIVKLIKDGDDDSLEGLCTILFTIGKDLDSEKNQPRMDEHYTQINLIQERRRTSPRIRYMLQDVLDRRTLHLYKGQKEDH